MTNPVPNPTPIQDTKHFEDAKRILGGNPDHVESLMNLLCANDLSIDASTLYEIAGGDAPTLHNKTKGEWALDWCRKGYRLQHGHGLLPRHLTEPREGAPGKRAFFHLRVRRPPHISKAPERAQYQFRHHLAMGDAAAAITVLKTFDVHATKDDCSVWPDFLRLHRLAADHPDAVRLEWLTPDVKP
jgi:hypothetical protein